MFDKEKYLQKLKETISRNIADYSLDFLGEDSIPIEEIAKAMKDSIVESLRDQYEYFKTQYERAEYVLNYFAEVKEEPTFNGNLEVEQDPVTGDLFITFPEELVKRTGWNPSDTLEWVRQTDGSYHLRKAQIW
jgi:hypothetical protein